MLRAIASNTGVFIHSRESAATVTGKAGSWLIQEGSEAGLLEVIRFNHDGVAEKPISLAMTGNGWKLLHSKRDQRPPQVKYAAFVIPMHAAQLAGKIAHDFPELTLSSLLLPANGQQSTIKIYAEYTLANLDPAVYSQHDRRCAIQKDTVAVKSIPMTKIFPSLAKPRTLFFSRDLAHEPVKTPIAEVEAALGMIWTETNVVRPYHVTEIRWHMQSAMCMPIDINAYTQFIERLESNRDKIGISYAGDEIGYVVIAMEDIPEATMLTSYSGCMRPRSDALFSNSANSRYSITYGSNADELLFLIDGNQYRNFGALFPHLPSSETLSRYACQPQKIAKIPGTNKPDIATANICMLKYSFNLFPFAVMETTRAVRKGDILGFDYDMEYWKALGATPALLDTKGRPHNSDHYKAGKILIYVKNDKTGEALALDDTLAGLDRHFKANHGYYPISADGIEMAICGVEFALKHLDNPRCLYMELEDRLDEYRAALGNTMGVK